MAKKKKKAAPYTPQTKDDVRSVGNQNSQKVVDLLQMRLLRSTFTPKSSFKPQVKLSEEDAAQLNVQTGEDLILITTGSSNPTNIVGMVICQVEISSSSEKSPKMDSRYGSVGPTTMQLSSSSLIDVLLPNVTTDVDVPDGTPSKQTKHATPVTPSSSSSSFSFKNVGNEDRLYSTPTMSSPSQTPSKLSSTPIFVIPLDSNFGEAVQRRSVALASTICIKKLDDDINVHCSEVIVEKLFLATYRDTYLQPGQRLTILYKGKPLNLEVTGATNDRNDATILAEEMDALYLTDHQEDISDEALLILSCLKKVERYTFKVTSETTIHLENQEKVEVKGKTTKVDTFVVGLDSVFEKIRSLLLTPILRPDLFVIRNLKKPKGVLLHGPSGVGKTCIAKQIAMQLKTKCLVQYVNCTSLQSRTSIVGEAERELTKLFRLNEASTLRDKLLILDDIHLICPRRGGHNTSTDQLAATLLALVDGISDKDHSCNIMILAITSNPSLLDPALRRPGRLDSEVEVPIPDDVATRSAIFRFHLEYMQATASTIGDEDWDMLGKLAKGFNGADCMLAVKDAIRFAYKHRESIEERSEIDLRVDVTASDMHDAIKSTKPSVIKSVTVEIPKVLWSSIGGMDVVKKELREAIDLPLSHAELFSKMNVPPPRGILLYGPPGCSKTLMARALATEGHMNFLAVKGPELLSKWLGESERALASLFRRARMASPSIIFFDEIDAIASKRGTGDSASTGRLLSQLLTELDGVSNTATSEKKQRVVVVGATNRPDLLDSALTRPGRIDRMIYVGIPDAESRAQIFHISLRDKSCSDDIDIQELASNGVSHGFSGAELVAICRDAALMALEESDSVRSEVVPKIYMRHLRKAIDGMQRQITQEMLDFYASFRGKNYANATTTLASLRVNA